MELVQGGATLRYKKDVNTVVSGSVSLVVDGNNTESVRGRKETYVQGTALLKVLQDYAMLVEGSTLLGTSRTLTITTPQEAVFKIGADLTLTASGSINSSISGDLSVSIGGSESRSVGGNRSVTVGGGHTMTPVN